jgi:hypothetical protein
MIVTYYITDSLLETARKLDLTPYRVSFNSPWDNSGTIEFDSDMDRLAFEKLCPGIPTRATD